MKFNYFLWAIYIIAFPFYVFPEGNPQIADIFGALLILASIKPLIENLTSNSFARYLFYFVIYSFIINTVWMVILHDFIILKYSIFYLYSFLFASFVFRNLTNKKFLTMTFIALILSLSLQTLLWPFADQDYRVIMYFNNPNQLALWGVCMLVILNGIHMIEKQKFSLVLLGSLLATFMVALSLSRAGMGCCVLFWVFFYVKSRRNFIILSVISVLIVGYVVANNSFEFDKISVFKNISDRIERSTALNQSAIGDRGFDRIAEFPQYTFFGAGEGLVERFNSPIEIHNTFLNVFFSYGIIGFLIFCLAIKQLFFKPYRAPIILFLVISLYASVHMPLRIPFLWIALFIIYFLKVKKENTELVDNENALNLQ